MILPTVFELAMVGVVDRGVPNRERIVLRPTENVNLHAFFLTLAVRAMNGMVQPLQDNVFWFPELVVTPPSWVVVYTGPGTQQKTVMPDSHQLAHTLHWGKMHTVFDHPDIVPVVFALGAILLPAPSHPPSELSKLAPRRLAP